MQMQEEYSQEYIDGIINEFFAHEITDDTPPTSKEVTDMVRDLLNEYVNGNEHDSRYAFNFFVNCSLENVYMGTQIRIIMTALSKVNERYKNLARMHESLQQSYELLKAKNIALMQERDELIAHI